jgi:hypothetical protein
VFNWYLITGGCYSSYQQLIEYFPTWLLLIIEIFNLKPNSEAAFTKAAFTKATWTYQYTIVLL